MAEIVPFPLRNLMADLERPEYAFPCPVVPFAELVGRALQKRGDLVPNAHLAYEDLFPKKGEARPFC